MRPLAVGGELNVDANPPVKKEKRGTETQAAIFAHGPNFQE